MFTRDKIIDYADKLLIGLSEEEVDLLLSEFDVINENMEMINKIDGLKEVKPLSFPQMLETKVLREDTNVKNISTEDALKNSGDVIEDVVCVPKVVG